MIKKFLDIIKSSISNLVFALLVIGVIWYQFYGIPKNIIQPLKEYKDGVQNHLIWDIKGQCYFVRPNDDVTVYLVRVNDCDKK